MMDNLHNDFDDYNLYPRVVLDVYKSSFILQSGEKSRLLDFIFDLVIKCLKSIFYVYFYMILSQQKYVKRKLVLKWESVCSFLVAHFLK